jgi:hypothetical protein
VGPPLRSGPTAQTLTAEMREYAPEYTKRERIIYVLKLLAWVIPIALFLKLWFFEWLTEFSRNANCYNYGSINGVHLVVYGLFVIMPLSFALVLFLIEGRRSIKIIKLGQNPLPNEKVLNPTKYKYGFAAKIQPFIMLSSILCLVGISVWGGFQAYETSKNIKPCAVKNE